jgi:AcrR family transcriptional regulator
VADRKQEILDAALRGFADKGLAGTTVEEVRRRSGASVGSIYHHFGDKEGIAAALYVAALGDYQEGLLAVLAAADDDPQRTVEALVRHHLRWVAEDRGHADRRAKPARIRCHSELARPARERGPHPGHAVRPLLRRADRAGPGVLPALAGGPHAHLAAQGGA